MSDEGGQREIGLDRLDWLTRYATTRKIERGE